MRDMSLTDLERLEAGTAESTDASETLLMDEDAFRLLYERTARPLWVYLARLAGDPRLADDLLQETYYRFLRAGATHESDDHRRNYLYRIATNLAHDLRRQSRGAPTRDHSASIPSDPAAPGDPADRIHRRVDLGRALARLKPRERALLWLAYADGRSHREIAQALGLQAASIKLLLFRARRRLATLLNGTHR